MVQLSVTFEVEDEERPDLGALVAEIEHRLQAVDGVDEVFADVGGVTKKFAIVVELCGDSPDCNAATSEMAEAVRALVPRLANGPRTGPVWPLEEDDDVSE